MKFGKIIEQMTVKEKCALLTGKDNWQTYPIERLGVPEIMMADGPHGLRKESAMSDGQPSVTEQAVCYPSAVNIASSFDPETAAIMGEAIAKECRSKNVHVLLAPGINIKRNPLCGRNFEYYSEDPHVSAEMAKGFIAGLKKHNIGSCIKHFALNSQETYRMISSSIADPRTKQEIYYKAFHDALAADPEMVMCSYNRINDTFASENTELLDETLRRRFGYEKVIVSDWGAVKDRTKALAATLDLEMPGYHPSREKLEQDLQSGKITMLQIDKAVERILELIFSKKDNTPVDVDLETNHEIAKKIAEETMVLLKNTEGILPLKDDESIALIGELARKPRYQGGGSSHVNAYRVDSMLGLFPKGSLCEFAPGYSLDGDGYDQSLVQEAKTLARRKDKVVLVIGLTDLYESEGYDRTHLDLPQGHVMLLEALAEVNPNIVVVLQLGSPVVMPWIGKVKGLLNAYLFGEAGAKAVIDILYGKVNPSGRLAETFAMDLKDIPSTRRFAKGNNHVYYQEGIYVGYRYFLTANRPVLFPFGYGLSYTRFEYSDLEIDMNPLTMPGKVNVSVKVKNVGGCFGKEVVQLYVKNPQTGIFRPLRELRKFTKINLAPDEEVTLTFELGETDFSYFNIAMDKFFAPNGEYEIEICQNANEVILNRSIQVLNPINEEIPKSCLEASSYYAKGNLEFKNAEYENLIQMPLESEHIERKRPFHLEDTLNDLSRTWIGNLIRKMIVKRARKTISDQAMLVGDHFERMLSETSLRSLVLFSNNMVSMDMMEGIIALCNRKYIKGLKLLSRSGKK